MDQLSTNGPSNELSPSEWIDEGQDEADVSGYTEDEAQQAHSAARWYDKERRRAMVRRIDHFEAAGRGLWGA
jgi:hypothetical protein